MLKVPKIESISDVVSNHLCISCGACVSGAPPSAIEMHFSNRYAMSVPVIVRPYLIDGRGIEFDVCPGKGCDILRLSEAIKDNETQYDLELGFVHKAWVMQSNNNVILKNASSGGLMTQIAAYLLTSGRVRGVIATKMHYSSLGPRPKTVIAESLEELLECQGSKYLPVSVNQILGQLESYHGPVVFIGTPCQIESLRMLQERAPIFKKRIPYVIGNFCGGIKDFRELNTQIKRQGMNPSDVVRFRYRGGGQPGSMLIEDSAGRIKQRSYLDYSKDTGYKKHTRCRLCIDGTAELADFSCGDAWIERFLLSDTPWSIVITRNSKATLIIQEMIEQVIVKTCSVTLDDIKKSQKSNLHSKKIRQSARRKLYNLLGKPTPLYDGGYSKENSSLWLEAKVHFAYWFLQALERLHLYAPLSGLLRRLTLYHKDGHASEVSGR